MTTIDARDPLDILTHQVKLLTERLDWLEIHVKELQDNRITDVHVYNDMSLDNLRQLIRSEMERVDNVHPSAFMTMVKK